MRRIAAVICIISIFLCGCRGNGSDSLSSAQSKGSASSVESLQESQSPSSDPDVPSQITSKSPDVSDGDNRSAEDILAEMTLSEKVSQLFILQPEDLSFSIHDGAPVSYGSEITAMTPTVKTALSKYNVGGIIMFAPNIVSPSQLSRLMSDFDKESDVPMFYCIDEEGGRVARIADNSAFGVTKFESMLSVGQNGMAEDGYNVGSVIGQYLKRFGFNFNFAPVGDVFTNPLNTIIGNRAFSTDAETAAQLVAAAVRGFKDRGIITSVKHFPGHGDTSVDTHSSLAYVDKSWDELMECEMLPFISAIEAGADTVMVGHIVCPNVTDDGLPASLSYSMITEKLKGELGFDGLVITDSLSMGAIKDVFGSGKAAVKAFLAGSDILLMPDDFFKAHAAMVAAVTSGEISKARLDESVLKILKLKEKYRII